METSIPVAPLDLPVSWSHRLEQEGEEILVFRASPPHTGSSVSLVLKRFLKRLFVSIDFVFHCLAI